MDVAGVPEPGLISRVIMSPLGKGGGLKTSTVRDPLAKAFVGSSPTLRTTGEPSGLRGAPLEEEA